jgi:murein L,D-transpeptidase YcbB/YkuD
VVRLGGFAHGLYHGRVKAGLILCLFVLAGLPWFGSATQASPRADAVGLAAGLTAEARALDRLAARLRRLEEDGLDPAAYGIPSEQPGAEQGPAWRAALNRAAVLALTDLLHGRVRDLPGRVDLRRDTARVPLGPWLSELVRSPDPAGVIDRAALATPDAALLKAELARARMLVAAGGWQRIPGGAPAETIEPGVDDPLRVPLLRARLAATDRAIQPGDSPIYDDALREAVRRFQAEQGLEADGRVGRITLAALNRPPEATVRQLRVALDMRRAAAPPPAERRIEVNVPHQRLTVQDGDRVLLDMAVIVGRPARATPMMAVRLNAVQFNPPWGVPERNAKEDLLPRFRRDPRAMMEKGFRVYTYVDGERVEVNATAIDWRSVSATRFPYFIRQNAGDNNALGRIKFIMPNTEDIFMHDTPDRHLFRRPDRAFSSGCIRLEKPMELLDIVMEGMEGWNRARVARVLDSRQTSGAALARSVPVRLHYTSVVVEGGELRMRSDIYGLDEAYARALDAGLSTRARIARIAAR